MRRRQSTASARANRLHARLVQDVQGLPPTMPPLPVRVSRLGDPNGVPKGTHMSIRPLVLTAALCAAVLAAPALAQDGAAPAAPPAAGSGEKVKLTIALQKGQTFA